MQKLTTHQYNQIFFKLPPEIRDVVASLEVSEKIYDIGTKNKLHLDMIKIFHDITMDVMMGIIALKDYRDELVRELKISQVEANMMMHEVDEQVMKPIKDLMIKIYANEAPFKPGSSQSLNDVDEEHSDLNKDDILKEIENPSESKVRRDTYIPEVRGAKFVYENEPIDKLSSSTELEEFHDELVGKSVSFKGADEAEMSSNTNSAFEEAKKRILESITAAKITGVVLMPKVGGIFSEAEKMEMERTKDAPVQTGTIEPITQQEVKKESKTEPEIKINPTVPGQPEGKAKIDNVVPSSPQKEQSKPSVDPYREPVE